MTHVESCPYCHRSKAEITGDTGRAFYAIKLMDATGNILKSEERDLAGEVRVMN